MRTWLVLIGLCPVLGACSSANDPLYARQRCDVADSDKKLYAATDLTPLDALEAAFAQCRLQANDPASCIEVACQPVH